MPHGYLEDDANGQSSRLGNRRTPGLNDTNPYSAINLSGGDSRTRYISCTPLFGSDDQVGVWMIVMVENEQVTGNLVSREAGSKKFSDVRRPQSDYERESRTDDINGDMEDMRLYGEFLKSQGKETSGADSMFNNGEKDGLMDGILGVLGDRDIRL